MKKLTALIALISIFSLTGCGEEPVVSTALPNTAIPTSTPQVATTPKPFTEQIPTNELPTIRSEVLSSAETVEIALGEKDPQEEQELQYLPVNSEDLFWDGFGSLHVKSYCLIEDGGESLIAVTADFTNLHPEIDLSSSSLGPAAYQSGVRLTQYNHTSYAKDVYTQIKSGATLEVCIVYQLRDTTTPVEIELGADSIVPGDQTKPTGVCTIVLQ